MTRKYELSDFPLKPIDCHGRALAAGQSAKIVAVPDIDFHGFNAVARRRYSALKGRVLPITEFEDSGYAVFSLWYSSSADVAGKTGEPVGVRRFATHDFYFDPRDLELV